MVSRLGCWLWVESCLRDKLCAERSGLRAGTLLARWSWFLEVVFPIAEEAEEFLTGSVDRLSTVLAFSLVIAGVEAREAENFLRFFRSAARAGPRPWENTWWFSERPFVLCWLAAWECSWADGSCGPPSKDDFESDDPSERNPPSSEAGGYIESSDRDLPAEKICKFYRLYTFKMIFNSFNFFGVKFTSNLFPNFHSVIISKRYFLGK